MQATSPAHLALRYADPTEIRGSSVVVVERFVGPRSAQELTRMTEKLVARWDPAVRIRLLVDLTAAELGSVGLADLKEYVRYAERIGLHERAPRVAIVAERDATHNLALLYRALVGCGERGVAVFADVESALSWIRDTPEDLAPRASAHDARGRVDGRTKGGTRDPGLR